MQITTIHADSGGKGLDESFEHVICGRSIRRIILEQSKRAGIGHIGCGLSVADIIAAVYGVLRLRSARDPERDRFVLSKGHAALALYGAMFLRGLISQAQLDSFCGDDTLLGVHPEHELPGIDFSTGSLGQGLSMGAGAALAARLQESERRVYVLMSDAECNEGAVWEAAMFAAHQRLGNLIAIIDLNGQQALGYTRDVCHIPNMAERWRAFGWDVHETDGHDRDALCAVLEACAANPAAPHMVVARTTFGKGVSFMENQIRWHYVPMNDADYARATEDVGTE